MKMVSQRKTITSSTVKVIKDEKPNAPAAYVCVHSLTVSGQPNIENGRSPDENQVSSTSSSINLEAELIINEYCYF